METAINNEKDILQQEINELKQKYDVLINDVKCLEDNKNNMKDIVKSSYEVVQNLSKNMENIMNELNNLKKDYENTTTNNFVKDDKMNFSLRGIFTDPLRKIAVGTIQSAFLMADKTVESISNVKEGFEDIVAEAQYQNKKKHLETTENN